MSPVGYTEGDVARLVHEPAKSTDVRRSPFERDRARVLHSAALRRLAGKTQVVGVGEDDFPRTRLTHSLECAQIGRGLAEGVGADPDVVDAACLAHDLGHPPFGHNGEEALDEAATACGGFEGNAQSLRILVRLEAKTLDDEGNPAGLNLTRATLDASTKYPWVRRGNERKYGVYADDVAAFTWLRAGAGPGDGRRCIEAQLMDWADDVAYSVHDLEDGLHAEHVRLETFRDHDERVAVCETAAALYSGRPVDELVRVFDDLLALPFWPTLYDGSPRALVALKRLTSEFIARFSVAAVSATREAYGDGPLTRYAADLVVPADIRAECALLKAVTAHYVMSRADLLAVHEEQRAVIGELVPALADRGAEFLSPALAPAWHAASTDADRLRVVVDQVASLTDASARAWHARLR
ncbi:MAG: dGTPase [Frankiaceae bacterium]|nr:dGTPase [Frankiaceae bacterium]